MTQHNIAQICVTIIYLLLYVDSEVYEPILIRFSIAKNHWYRIFATTGQIFVVWPKPRSLTLTIRPSAEDQQPSEPLRWSER